MKKNYIDTVCNDNHDRSSTIIKIDHDDYDVYS